MAIMTAGELSEMSPLSMPGATLVVSWLGAVCIFFLGASHGLHCKASVLMFTAEINFHSKGCKDGISNSLLTDL